MKDKLHAGEVVPRLKNEVVASVLNRTEQLYKDALAGDSKSPVKTGFSEASNLDMAQYGSVVELDPPADTKKVVAWEQKKAGELGRSLGHVMGLTDNPNTLAEAVRVVAARPELAQLDCVKDWVVDAVIENIKSDPNFVLEGLNKIEDLKVFGLKPGEEVSLLSVVSELREAVVNTEVNPGIKMSEQTYMEGCDISIDGYTPTEDLVDLGVTLTKVVESDWYEKVPSGIKMETEAALLAITLSDIRKFEEGGVEYRKRNVTDVARKMLAIVPDLSVNDNVDAHDLAAYLLKVHIDNVGVPANDQLAGEVVRLKKEKQVQDALKVDVKTSIEEKRKRITLEMWKNRTSHTVTPQVEGPGVEPKGVVEIKNTAEVQKTVVEIGVGPAKAANYYSELFTKVMAMGGEKLGLYMGEFLFTPDHKTFTLRVGLNEAQEKAISEIVKSISFLTAIGEPDGWMFEKGKYSEKRINALETSATVLATSADRFANSSYQLTRNRLMMSYMGAFNRNVDLIKSNKSKK